MTEQTDITNYCRGFNEGYLIEKHLPKLSTELGALSGNAPRIEGFRDGQKQCVLEQVKSHRLLWLAPTSSTIHSSQKPRAKTEI